MGSRALLALSLSLLGCGDVVPCQGTCVETQPPVHAMEAMQVAWGLWAYGDPPALRWVAYGDCDSGRGFIDRGACVVGLFLPYHQEVWLAGAQENALWWALPHETLHGAIWNETNHDNCDSQHHDGRWGEPLEIVRHEMIAQGFGSNDGTGPSGR